jgi:hypothetical protein
MVFDDHVSTFSGIWSDCANVTALGTERRAAASAAAIMAAPQKSIADANS